VPRPSLVRTPSSPSKAPALQMLTTWFLYNQPGSGQRIGWPIINTSTIVGISVAIAGNVLISLALNTQKLAHKRVEKANLQKFRELQTANGTGHAHLNGNRPWPNRASVELDEDDRIPEEDPSDDVFGATTVGSPGESFALETEPLIGGLISSSYGAVSGPQPVCAQRAQRERRNSIREGAQSPVDFVNETSIFSDLARARHPKFVGKQRGNALGGDNGKEIDYLKSKLWYVLLWTLAFLIILNLFCSGGLGFSS
jgi:hypothetical protein